MEAVSGVHLNGSMPFASAEENMRFACRMLGGSLKRLPDGEPGERQHFTRWQAPKVQNYISLQSTPSNVSSSTMTGIHAANAQLETGYDEAAVSSYEVFRKLKQEGVIPSAVRFMVSLPTPISAITLNVEPGQQEHLEILYEAAILRALRRIQKAVPAKELAIQWDTPLEFMFLENATFAGKSFRPWWNPLLEGIVERLARLASYVDADVEMGFHFCYGDSNKLASYNRDRGTDSRFFAEPKDMTLIVTMANSLVQRCGHSINWISMPVPAYRMDAEFYRPLQELCLGNRPIDIILGLIYEDDTSNAIRRIQAASEAVPKFAIASPCGLGRCAIDRIVHVFGIYAEVLQNAGQGSSGVPSVH